jgi:hypothetical protein
MTPQEAAQEAYDHLTSGTRKDGKTYRYFDDTTPDWVHDLAHDAHGDMFPDDWRYDFIYDALSDFADGVDVDDTDIAPDVYTVDLLAWLASNLSRLDYCDEATAEYGTDDSLGILGAISIGQYAEKREVYDAVWQSINDHAEED